MSHHRQELGQHGEEVAAQTLILQGLKIVARRWRCRFGEIDLIAVDEATGQLIFVEVKTRTTYSTYGSAEQAVTLHKQRKVRNLALLYLKMMNYNREPAIRFDVIAIVMNKCDFSVVHLNHLRGAF